MTMNFRRKQANPTAITVMRQLYQDYNLNSIRSPTEKRHNRQASRLVRNCVVSSNLPFQVINQKLKQDNANCKRLEFTNTSSGNLDFDYTHGDILAFQKSMTSRKGNKNNDISHNLFGDSSQTFNLLTRKKFRMKINKHKDKNLSGEDEQFCLTRKMPNYAMKMSNILYKADRNSQITDSVGSALKKEVFLLNKTQKRLQLSQIQSGFQRRNKKKLSHCFRTLSRGELQEVQSVNRGYFKNQYTKSHPLFKPHPQICEKIQTLKNSSNQYSKMNSTNYLQHSQSLKLNVNGNLQNLKFQLQTQSQQTSNNLNSPLLNLKEMKDHKKKMLQFSEIKRENFKKIRENYLLKYAYKQNNQNFACSKAENKQFSSKTKQNVFPQ